MDHFSEFALVAAAKFIAMMIGVYGGIARYLSEVLDNKKDFAWPELVMVLISSGFFGYMGGEIGAYLFTSPNASYIAAGMIGFLGPRGLEHVLSKLIKK